MKNIFYLIVLALLYYPARSQFVYNNGATIFSEQGAVIKIQGSIKNDQLGSIIHNGLIIIDSTYINNTTASTQGNGIYDVYENWINSGLFLKDTSTVNLKGLAQNISGDSISRYYNLNLLGSGEKKLFLNSTVSNKLDLNTNILATQQDTMFLLNPAGWSLLGSFSFGSEGLISNLDSGAFVRATNSNSSYYYPMGSTTGTQRFRPIQITPNNSNTNNYSVSFHNIDPSIHSYSITVMDTTICRVNNKFFHKIGRLTGNSPADIEIGYLPSIDFYYNSVANWKNVNNLWADITSVNTNSFIGSYNSNKRSSWNNFSNLPYSLASTNPVIHSLSGDSIICNGNNSVYTFTNGGSYTYDWSVTGGTFNNNDSISNSASITWQNAGSNSTTLVITDSIGCSSKPFKFMVNVNSLPSAGFTLVTPPFSVGTPITVIDSSYNATSYYYDLGNGTTSTGANAQTVFNSPGTYQIYQVVYNVAGCADTATKTIYIDETILIPNVFTPNGDGSNDAFSFNCAGCADYDLDINNRWGQLIYRGNKGSEFWDGTTGTGEKVPEGTYFYILKINSGHDEKLFKGFINLFR